MKVTIKNTAASIRLLRIAALVGVTAAALLLLASQAHANSLVTNGSFEVVTNGACELGSCTVATGWSSSGYNFVYAPGTADTTGSYTPQFNGNLTLWGPGNGSANGLPATSPDGGNFVAADGAFEVGAITQTVNGLTAGDTYAVSFYWAGAQQSGFSGVTTEQWDVSLGAQTIDTVIVTDPSHGFTGWQYSTLDFTATSGSEVLSFLAIGTPNGEPPFSLLDGVSMNVVTPEPATLPLLLTGLMGGLGALRSRKWLKNR
jgi:hypothetical protein